MYEDKWTEEENKTNAENNTAMNREAEDSKKETEKQNPREGQRQQVYGLSGQTGQSSQQAYGQGGQGSQQAYGQTGQGSQQAYGQAGQGGQQAYGQAGQNGQQVYGQAAPNSQAGQNGQNGAGYSPYGQYSQGHPGYGHYNYSQGSQNQNHAHNPYTNPYQYGQNQNPGQNMAPNSNHKPPKKHSYMKTTALVTAAALLFGVVSGGTMFGVNRAAELMFPAETQAPESTGGTLGQTQVVPASPQVSSDAASGVVIEDVSPIVDAVMPSVVAITNTTLYKSSTWFGQSQTYEVPSSGSGIIIGQNDTELLIVTNNHVIEDSTSLAVSFIDESVVDAAIKGTDSESDLAVIAVPLEKISADTKEKIKAATLGDSDSLKMGQGVIAIGNALGHGQSVTVGHVSALDREITVDGITKKVIQTDAAINPGNSGGALLNSKGEVIGINEAKYADASVEGVGYAIPISNAKDIIEELKLRTTKIEISKEEQGYLGIQVQNVDSMMAQLYGMPQGVYVYKITEDSAAAASDLREKDIITKFDGETVRTNADLTGLLAYYKAGTKVTLTVQSMENGAYVERQVEVTLKSRPQQEEQ